MIRVLSAVVALLSIATADAGAFTIHGNVTNGTTNTPLASAHVIVVRPSTGMQEVASVDTKDGHFEFNNLADDAPIYVVRVEYQGALYNEPVRVNGKDQTVDIIVYEATTKWDGVGVVVPHLAAARQGDELMVEQTYEITNGSNPPRTVTAPGGAFRLFLPADMDSLLDCYVATGEMPLKRTPTPTDVADLYGIDYPIRPGVTRISIAYTLPYSGAYTMQHKFALPVSHMSVFAVDSTLQVSSPSHQFANTESVHGMTAYAVHDIAPNSTMTLVFTGGDPNFAGLNVDSNGNATGGQAGGENVVARPGEDEKISRFLMVTVLLVLAGVAGMSLRDRQDPLSDPQVLRAHYDLLLSRLVRLDDLHAAHAIPGDSYRLSRDELMGRLAALAMALRAHGGVHAPTPAPDRPAKPEATSKVQ